MSIISATISLQKLNLNQLKVDNYFIFLPYNWLIIIILALGFEALKAFKNFVLFHPFSFSKAD